jgi:hypothetical protein
LLRRLDAEGWLRLLPSLPEPCPADMIRRPRLYLRARAWSQVFTANPHPGGCQRVPVQGQLAARVTDGIIEREQAIKSGSRFFAMGRYRRRGVDLVVSRATGWRIGFCFEPRPFDNERAADALRQALESGWIDAAILVCCQGSPVVRRGGVLYLPAPLLLAMYRQWASEATTSERLQALFRWLADQMLFLGVFWDPAEPPTLDFQYEGLPEEAEPEFFRPP